MRPSAAYWLTAVPLVLTACSSSADQASTTRDSAGVVIVENTADAWTAENAWRIEPEPLARIGEAEGAPEYELDGPRGGLRLPDGTIAFANGSAEIRFYDSSGKHVRTVGRAGAGPGEYRRISYFGRLGRDSLFVWDLTQHRGTLLGVDGTFARNTVKPAGLPFFLIFLGPFSDGSLLAQSDEGVQPALLPAGTIDSPTTLIRLVAAGSVDTVGTFYGGSTYNIPGKGMMGIPFGPQPKFAVAPGAFYYSTTATYEVRVYTREGTLQRIIRNGGPGEPITQQMIDDLIERRTARIKDDAQRQQQRATLLEIPFPKNLPSLGDLVADTEANLWVSDYRMAGVPQARWTVFDPAGRRLGRIQFPAPITVFEIGADYILGHVRVELDVDHVVLYRLVKPLSV